MLIQAKDKKEKINRTIWIRNRFNDRLIIFRIYVSNRKNRSDAKIRGKQRLMRRRGGEREEDASRKVDGKGERARYFNTALLTQLRSLPISSHAHEPASQ